MTDRRLQDRHQRRIDYLRVSLTDRCNLRCLYCLPEEGVTLKGHQDILTFEEIVRVVRVAVSLGVKGVRLTGGEPLVRKDLLGLVRELAAIDGLEDISLTTNGTLLAPLAAELKAAGLRRVNISLDTLRPERFAAVTRRPLFAETVAGVRAALAVGLEPVKLNVVLMRGFNDDEVVDFARLTRRPFAPGLGPVHVRFIELMPLGESVGKDADLRVTGEEVREVLSRVGELTPVGGGAPLGRGPAESYLWMPRETAAEKGPIASGAPGTSGVLEVAAAGVRPATIGLISAVTEHFCERCNRLRLTADGKINPCLASPLEVDLRGALRAGADDDELARLLRLAVSEKPLEHAMGTGAAAEDSRRRRMSRIGG
ncbi:MAG: GTP 3',8-cyclase MoaA [Bacillota bacterium]